jgi:hypothetical protein
MQECATRQIFHDQIIFRIKSGIYNRKHRSDIKTMRSLTFCALFAPLVLGFSMKASQNQYSLKAATTLEPKPRRWCLAGEPWPNAQETVTRKDALTVKRLDRRIMQLENVLRDLTSALVYADDMAMAERQTLQAGNIYLDMSSNVTRQPLLLRRAVADLARKHGNPVSPPVHHWS